MCLHALYMYVYICTSVVMCMSLLHVFFVLMLVKTSAVVAAIKASSPAHNTLLPLPSRDHLRYMTEGQAFIGYFPAMDGK